MTEIVSEFPVAKWVLGYTDCIECGLPSSALTMLYNGRVTLTIFCLKCGHCELREIQQPVKPSIGESGNSPGRVDEPEEGHGDALPPGEGSGGEDSPEQASQEP